MRVREWAQCGVEKLGLWEAPSLHPDVEWGFGSVFHVKVVAPDFSITCRLESNEPILFGSGWLGKQTEYRFPKEVVTGMGKLAHACVVFFNNGGMK